MKKVIWAMIGFTLLLTALAMAVSDDRPMLVRVDMSDKINYKIMRDNHIHADAIVPGQFVEIVVSSEEEYQNFIDLGLKPEIIHEDLVAFYQSRFPLGTTMGGFKTLAETVTFMDSLHNANPAITTARDSIGLSYQNRPLWKMKISDNPDIDEDEPEFFINSLIHAREPMGLEANLRFMKYLCENYGTDSLVTYLVDNREIYFVPVVNPDGYEYNRQTDPNGGGMWRKNRHGQGIDLNRNWGYMWGYDDNGSSPDPGDETYRGSGPFSEPETEALRQFINSRDFKVVMNFHTYGGYFLYSWGYIDDFTPDQPLMTVIGDSCTSNSGYSFGTAWQLLYNTNGDSDDWQYGEQTEKPKIFGFVFEIGESFDGFWPDPSRIPTLWNHVLEPLLFLANIAENPYAVGVPVAPTLNPIGDIYIPSFTINWQCHDTLNAPVAYELKELAGLQRTTDNIENGTSNWNLDGFSRVSNRRHGGTYSLFSGSDDNYNGAMTAVNPVTVAQNDTLKVWLWYDIETDWDYAYVQISTDGGANYINLEGNITTNDDPNGNNQGNGITGNSGGWDQGTFPLDDYAGQSAILAIKYFTDGFVLGEGLYADDFYPVESFTSEIVISSNITDTSYTFPSHELGEFYYQVRARDAQNQWSGFSNREIAIIHPSSGCYYTPGDANGNGQTNGLDVGYMVSWLKGGVNEPPNTCDCPPHGILHVAADANGNCSFNGLDVTYLVRYYQGSPDTPRGCPDCPPAR